MAATNDILRSWTGPRAVMRKLLALGPREDRALAYLMVGCLVIFVAQWPRLSRRTYLDGTPLEQLIAYEFVSWLIVWPLVLYLIALVIYVLMRATGPGIGAFQVRLALFWAVLAASPAALLYGLTAGFIGTGPAAQVTGALWLGALAVFVVAGLIEARAQASRT